MPLVINTADQIAAWNMIAGLKVGLNLERGRPLYMTWQGYSLRTSSKYYEYLLGRKVNWTRFFYGWRPDLNMMGEGTSVPNNDQIRRFLDCCSASVAGGMKMTHYNLTDVMPLWCIQQNRNAMKDYFERTCDLVAEYPLLTPAKFTLNPFNELEGEDNAKFNPERIWAHNIIRAKMPNYVLGTGSAYWYDPSRVFADDWQMLPDKRCFAEAHYYPVGSGTGPFAGWRDERVKFTEKHGIPVIWGESGFENNYNNPGGTSPNPVWFANMENYARYTPLMGAGMWSMNNGGWWDTSKGSDPTLRDDIDAKIQAIDGLYTGAADFGKTYTADGSTVPSTPPPAPGTVDSVEFLGASKDVPAGTAMMHRIKTTGLTRVGVVKVGPQSTGWNWMETTFHDTTGSIDRPITINNAGEFLKAIPPEGVNTAAKDGPQDFTIAATGTPVTPTFPAGAHLRLTSRHANVIIENQNGVTATIRLRRPLYQGNNLFDVQHVNTTAAVLDTFWTYKWNDTLGIQAGIPSIGRNLTSLDDGNITTDMVRTMAGGAVLQVAITFIVTPDLTGPAPAPSPIPDPRQTYFREDFDAGKGSGIMVQANGTWTNTPEGTIKIIGRGSAKGLSEPTEKRLPGWGHPHGKFRARVRLYGTTIGNNSGPAVVWWPADNIWPQGGEIDMGERMFGSGAPYGAVHHYNPLSTDPNKDDDEIFMFPANVDATQYLIYEVDWFKDRIVQYVNGVETGRSTFVTPDVYNGGVNYTLGVMNNSDDTGIEIDWYEFIPVALLDAGWKPGDTGPGPAYAPPVGWVQTFQDLFPGTSLDRNKWKIVFDGRDVQDAYNWDASRIIVNNGLTLRVDKVDGVWRAPGFMQGNNLPAIFHPGYTLYHARTVMRMSTRNAKGIGMYGLMWPWDNSWPNGEWDFIETPGATKDTIMITLHKVDNAQTHMFVTMDLTKEITIDTWRFANGDYHCAINGVEVPQPDGWKNTGIMIPQVFGLAGFVIGSNNEWYGGPPDATTPNSIETYVKSVTIWVPGPNSITLSPQSPGSVQQTAAGASVPVTVTATRFGFTGDMQAQVITSTGASRAPYATVTPNASGVGTFTGQIVASGDKIRFRKTGDDTVTATTDAITVLPFIASGGGGGSNQAPKAFAIIQGGTNASLLYGSGIFPTNVAEYFSKLVSDLTGAYVEAYGVSADGSNVKDGYTTVGGSFLYDANQGPGNVWVASSAGDAATWPLGNHGVAFQNFLRDKMKPLSPSGQNIPMAIIRAGNEYDQTQGGTVRTAAWDKAEWNLLSKARVALGLPNAKSPVFFIRVPYANSQADMLQAIADSRNARIAATINHARWGASFMADVAGDGATWQVAGARMALMRSALAYARWMHDNGYSKNDLSWLPARGGATITAATRVTGSNTQVRATFNPDKGTRFVQPTDANWSPFQMTDLSGAMDAASGSLESNSTILLTFPRNINGVAANCRLTFGLAQTHLGAGVVVTDNWHLNAEVPKPAWASGIAHLGDVRFPPVALTTPLQFT